MTLLFPCSWSSSPLISGLCISCATMETDIVNRNYRMLVSKTTRMSVEKLTCWNWAKEDNVSIQFCPNLINPKGQFSSVVHQDHASYYRYICTVILMSVTAQRRSHVSPTETTACEFDKSTQCEKKPDGRWDGRSLFLGRTLKQISGGMSKNSVDMKLSCWFNLLFSFFHNALQAVFVFYTWALEPSELKETFNKRHILAVLTYFKGT